MSVEERYKLECVSKQFQRTVFEGKISLDIDLYDLEDKGFLERLQHILKDFKNIEIIRIDGDYSELKTRVQRVVETLFDSIHDFCKNWTKFILEIECIPKEVMKRFFEKFGSNIIEIRICEAIPKVLASNKESNVEKIELFNDFDSLLNEIKFKRLKNLKFRASDTQDLDPLEVFIERNQQNIKHLEIFVSNNFEMRSEEQTIILDVIPNLSNLVELKLRFYLDFTFAEQLTRIATNCKQLKSIEIRFILFSENCEDINELMELLKQFKQLRRLEVIFEYFDDNKVSIDLFSFKVFKGLQNITHLSIGFPYYSEPFSETILTDIDINLPKLQYFKFYNRLFVTEWTVVILSRLSRLETIVLKISGKLSQLNECELKSKLFEKCKRIQNIYL